MPDPEANFLDQWPLVLRYTGEHVYRQETAMRRIREYVLPWEDAQVRLVISTGSFVGKILIVEREWVTGRMAAILVRKPIGI